MALPAVAIRDMPKFTLVAQYTVGRLGLMPIVTITNRDCVYLMETMATVESASDQDGDGKYEVLVLPELGGRTDLVGRRLAWPDSSDLGVIESVTQIEVTPEQTVTNPDGTTTTIPATYKAQATLIEGITPSPAGQTIGLVAVTVYKTPAYSPTPAGKEWDNILSGPVAMAYLSARLEAAYVAAVEAILPELGITSVSTAQVTTAVRALAAQSTNIESFIAEQAEQVELDRRAGTVPWLRVAGNAPTVG